MLGLGDVYGMSSLQGGVLFRHTNTRRRPREGAVGRFPAALERLDFGRKEGMAG